MAQAENTWEVIKVRKTTKEKVLRVADDEDRDINVVVDRAIDFYDKRKKRD